LPAAIDYRVFYTIATWHFGTVVATVGALLPLERIASQSEELLHAAGLAVTAIPHVTVVSRHTVGCACADLDY
jgi:hypothetical protein